jgi:dUTP pyrophosphatase
MLKNSVGLIDSGYRGEVKFRFSPDSTRNSYIVGDKIGQIVFLKIPQINLEESDSLSKSTRGSDGFGSTGR